MEAEVLTKTNCVCWKILFTKDEIMLELGQQVTRDQVKELLFKLDSNGDGTIDFDEFYNGFGAILMHQQTEMMNKVGRKILPNC